MGVPLARTQLDMPPPAEIELKLRLPAGGASAMRRHPVLRSLATGRPVTRRLTSVYFDSPDFLLARRRMALRIRHLENGTRVQTLKAPLGTIGDAAPGAEGWPAAADGSLQVNREFQQQIVGDVPDLALVEDAELQSFFAESGLAENLHELFSTVIKRTTWDVRMFDAEIEVALDEGEIRQGEGGAGRADVSELELELRAGSPARLYELGLTLHRSVPVAVESLSKSARGYALVASGPAPVHHAAPVHLDPAMSPRAAFSVLARSCLTQIRANAEVVLSDDSADGLHQARIGVRRLRALLTAFRPLLAVEAKAYLATELRWLQQQLGAARDWDVLALRTLAPLVQRSRDEGIALLLNEAEASRSRAREQARSILQEPRYTTFLLTAELWLENGGWAAPEGQGAPAQAPSLLEFAAAVLQRRHKQLRKAGAKHDAIGEEELHRVRILGKKLRYSGEFFRSLFSHKRARAYLAAVTEIQDLLGALNDAVVARGLLAELEQRLGRRARRPALARALGRVEGWHAERLDRSLEGFGEAWRKFAAVKAFWPKPSR